MRSLITAIILVLFFKCQLNGQETLSNDHPFKPGFSYIGDVVTNFSGGIKKGMRYLGLLNLKIGIKTEGLGLWRGGMLFINASNAHGGDPSADLIGDFHIVSNIETANITYLHELWYKQRLGSFEFNFGLQDLNTEFISTEFGSLFINSTFGTPSTIANNIPSPIFPLTALGASFKVEFAGDNSLKLALFDGLPTSFTDNPHNLRWEIKKKEGIFAITEFESSGDIRGLEGTCRGGIYYHSQLPETGNDLSVPGRFSYNYGIYIIADQTILENSDGEGVLGIFGQLAVSPAKINLHHIYFGTGMSLTGVIPRRQKDVAGIAFNRTWMSDPQTGNESVVEMSYRAEISNFLFLQPDFQYVMNPGGAGHNLRNAFTGLIRAGLIF
ncbi:MAG TPA: carbohydrate porin [Bacteroidales bacterium]|nr:carbohydrate porin [Bacteroidales bacterium]